MTPETQEIIAQTIGIIAMVIAIASFQFKKNKHFFIVQGISSTLFFIHFLLLGELAGAFMNLLGIARSVCLNVKMLRNRICEIILVFGFCVAAVFTYQNWLTILILVAQVIGTIVYWKNNAKHIRIYQLSIGSPFWLIHNIINFSIGGIITEVFNLISTTISIIRFHKSGFDKGE
jgi:hypothetical protein